MKKTYRVCVVFKVFDYYTVDATNEAEARELAEEEASEASLNEMNVEFYDTSVERI